MTTGRPSSFTQEIADTICTRIADGESLRAICRDDAMPGKTTVFRWLLDEKYREFWDQYARAREMQADTFVDEIPDIADDGSNDWMLRNGKDGVPGYVENGEALNRSRIRIDARKWMAGKLRPKKYGEKVVSEVSGPDGKPIQQEHTGSALDLIASRIAGLSARGRQKDSSGGTE